MQRNKVKNLIEIKKLLKFVDKDRGPIEKVYPNILYNDEPKIYSFTACLKNTAKITDGFSANRYAVGSAFSKEKALLRALGEAIERYFLSIYKEKNLIWRSYKELKYSKVNRIDPQDFVTFSNSKFIKQSKFELYKDRNNKLSWVKGFSLTQGSDVFIPAQIVFIPYHFKLNEPIIRLPISTGAACYSSLKGAILKGLLEVIERDAYMISYLNKLSRNIIDISSSQDEAFKKITSSIKRYNLELCILDISNEVPVYSILAILIDRTGYGPAISVGIKSDLDVKNAIIGAIEELFHGRFWIRDTLFKTKTKKLKEIQDRKYFSYLDLKERGLFWSRPEAINKIKFFLKGKKIPIKNYSNKKAKNLNCLLNWFKQEEIETIYVDVAPPDLKRKKVYVVKVIVPQFQPLCLDERFPHWDGERLRNIPLKLGFKPLKTVNKIPQPFM
jgi:ribosomal protein S12 methylthiotransferase accessory factor